MDEQQFDEQDDTAASPDNGPTFADVRAARLQRRDVLRGASRRRATERTALSPRSVRALCEGAL